MLNPLEISFLALRRFLYVNLNFVGFQKEKAWTYKYDVNLVASVGIEMITTMNDRIKTVQEGCRARFKNIALYF